MQPARVAHKPSHHLSWYHWHLNEAEFSLAFEGLVQVHPVTYAHSHTLSLTTVHVRKYGKWMSYHERTVNDFEIHYSHLQPPPKKERAAAEVHTLRVNGWKAFSVFVCVCVCVCLQSIFSQNMPAASNARLILAKPCHGTPLSLFLSLYRYNQHLK